MTCNKCGEVKPQARMMSRAVTGGGRKYRNRCLDCDTKDQRRRKNEKQRGVFVPSVEARKTRPDGLRLCSRCEEMKPEAEFSPDSRRGGLKHHCKPCAAVAATKRYVVAKETGLCCRCHKPNDYSSVLCRECCLKTAREGKIRRSSTKSALVEMLGGICMDCGLRSKYFEVYDFHHRDPSQKLFEVSNKVTMLPPEVLAEEALKCDLLCANCHRIRHQKMKMEEWDRGVVRRKIGSLV